MASTSMSLHACASRQVCARSDVLKDRQMIRGIGASALTEMKSKLCTNTFGAASVQFSAACTSTPQEVPLKTTSAMLKATRSARSRSLVETKTRSGPDTTGTKGRACAWYPLTVRSAAHSARPMIRGTIVSARIGLRSTRCRGAELEM